MAKYNKHLLIFGSARSGTSWLSESISRKRGYRLLFEPDHPGHVEQGRLLADKWLDPDKDYPELDVFLQKLFRNRINNDWIAQNSFRKFKAHLWPFLSRFYIIKFIRSNLAMEYITLCYDIPAVKIIRHPEKTLHSQWRVGFPWLLDLGLIKQQERLMNVLYERTGIEPQTVKDPFERLVLRWGIENALFPVNKNVSVYLYDDLVSNQDLIASLMENVGMQVPDNLKYQLGRPSTKTHPKSHIRNKWDPPIEELSDLQKSTVTDILQRFPYAPHTTLSSKQG